MVKRKLIKKIRRRKLNKNKNSKSDTLKDKVQEKQFEKPSPLIDLLMKKMLGNPPPMSFSTPMPQMPVYTSDNYNGEFNRHKRIIEENEHNSDLHRMLEKNKELSNQNKRIAEENMELVARMEAGRLNDEDEEIFKQKVKLMKDQNKLKLEEAHNTVKSKLQKIKDESIAQLRDNINKTKYRIYNLRNDIIVGKQKYVKKGFLENCEDNKKYHEHKDDYNKAHTLINKRKQLSSDLYNLDLDNRFKLNSIIASQEKIKQLETAWKKHSPLYHLNCQECKTFKDKIQLERNKIADCDAEIVNIENKMKERLEEIQNTKDELKYLKNKYGGIKRFQLPNVISNHLEITGRSLEKIMSNPEYIDNTKLVEDEELRSNIQELQYQQDLLKLYNNEEMDRAQSPTVREYLITPIQKGANANQKTNVRQNITKSNISDSDDMIGQLSNKIDSLAEQQNAYMKDDIERLKVSETQQLKE